MKLRIYALVVTLALIAALTNPSREGHYSKLESAYPWVSESLLVDAQTQLRWANPTDAPCEETEENSLTGWFEPPHLSYWNFGLASAVTSYPRYVPCPVGVTDRLLSFGLFGLVFLKSQTSAPAPQSGDESATHAKPTPSTYVIVSGSDVAKDDEDGAAKFFSAYKDFQKAEALMREGRKKEAKTAFVNVLEQLEQIKAQAPEWQPMVVDFRLERTRKHLDVLSKPEP